MSKPQAPVIPEDDIFNPKLNVSCLDFLLIELVPLAQRITDQLHVREQALIEEFRRSKIFNSNNNINHNHNDSNNASSTTSPSRSNSIQQSQPHPQHPPPPTVAVTESGKGTTVNTTSAVSTSAIGGAPYLENEETREAVFWRLDGLGYRVGQGLVERFSIGKPRPQSPLDAIKFICKDLWILLFRKQIDNLKTNHRGVYVLTDARFQPISRVSVDRRAGPKAGEEALRRAQSYLYFPCGVIRGALQGLGIEVTVTAETTEIPAATFQIKTKGAKA